MPSNKRTQIVVFPHKGYQCRARLRDGILQTLCRRSAPLYPWRKVPNAEAPDIWLAYCYGVNCFVCLMPVCECTNAATVSTAP